VSGIWTVTIEKGILKKKIYCKVDVSKKTAWHRPGCGSCNNLEIGTKNKRLQFL
jgi:hypothetical protein